MSDIFLIIQLAVLVMNIITFVYIMQEEKYNYKLARVIFIIICTVGLMANIGKVTFLTVLFSFSTFISLINIKHGNIHRRIEKYRGYFGRHKQHIQKLQGSGEALHRQKA